MPLVKWAQTKAADTELHQFREPIVTLKTDLETDLPVLQEIQGLSDELRTAIGAGGIGGLIPPQSDLQALDDYLSDEVDRIRDQLDYFDSDHENRTENLTVRDGAWYLPEALEAPLPDDDGTNVVANAIDNDGSGPNTPLNSSYWMSTINGTRVLIVRLRGYRKRVEGIRLRTNNGDTRAQLQNVTIKAAASLARIDDAENLVARGVNFDGASAWTEYSFVKARCRYLKLEIPSSNHSNPDHIRIRTLQVRVGITPHIK